jgi:hypothetical protein
VRRRISRKENNQGCPPRHLGGYDLKIFFEGICGWIPHEQVEGQSTFAN